MACPRDFMELPLSCGNEEALRCYNDGLRLLFKYVGGGVSLLEKACELDNSLILAHCAVASIWMADLKAPDDGKVAPHITATKAANQETLTEREKRHVEAMLSYAAGNPPRAMEQWAAITVEHPLDVLAIRLGFMLCIMLGKFEVMRNFLSAAIVNWTDSMELHPYLTAIYAFSLEETNFRNRAEEVARKALAAEPRVCWATHALSHVIEEDKDVAEGVELLTRTRSDWQSSGLGGHISWHLCLYYLDLEDTTAVLREFDTVLYDRITPDNLLGIINAASLLWRMELLGMDIGEKRWDRVTSACTEHVNTCGLAWCNLHIMMGFARGKVTEASARFERLLKSMKDYVRSDTSTNCKIVESIGLPVCNAFLAYGKGQYDEVVSLLLPLKYDVVCVGGSWAQRQVVHLTMLHAAMRSNNLPLALALASELKAIKPNNRYLRKLVDQLVKAVSHQLHFQPPASPLPLPAAEEARTS